MRQNITSFDFRTVLENIQTGFLRYQTMELIQRLRQSLSASSNFLWLDKPLPHTSLAVELHFDRLAVVIGFNVRTCAHFPFVQISVTVTILDEFFGVNDCSNSRVHH